MNYHVAVVGSGGGIGEALVGSLASTPAEVVFLDADRRAVDRAVAVGVDARTVDPIDGAALDREDIGTVGTAIVASREDGRNLLAAQHLRLRRAERVITLVNDPDNVAAFADAGVEPVCVSTVLAAALDRRRERGTTDAPNYADETSPVSETATGTERTERRVRDDRLRFDGNGGNDGNGEQ